MITEENLMIYKKYQGDIDAFTRMSTLDEQNIMGEEWHNIEEILQNVQLIRKGLVSKDYKAELLREIELKSESKYVVGIISNMMP